MECEMRKRYERQKDGIGEAALRFGASTSTGKRLMIASAEFQKVIDAHKKVCPICGDT
jgi:hypothetical protein